MGSEPPKTISIQKLNGDIFDISCTSDDTVQSRKRTIFNQEGYDIESQILVFKMERMDNDALTLKDFNIQNHSMLRIMIRNVQFDVIDEEEEDEFDDGVDDNAQPVELKPFSPQKLESDTSIESKSETIEPSENPLKPK